jgi:hypothetical protein
VDVGVVGFCRVPRAKPALRACPCSWTREATGEITERPGEATGPLRVIVHNSVHVHVHVNDYDYVDVHVHVNDYVHVHDYVHGLSFVHRGPG